MLLPSSVFPFKEQYGRFRGFGDWLDDTYPNFEQPGSYYYNDPAPGGVFPTQTYPTPDGKPPVLQPAVVPDEPGSSAGDFFMSLFSGVAQAFAPPPVRPTYQSSQPVYPPGYNPYVAQDDLPSWVWPVAGAVGGVGLLFLAMRKTG